MAGGIVSAAAGCTLFDRDAPPDFDGEGQIVFAAPRDISLGGQRRRAVQRWNDQYPAQPAISVDLPPAADNQRADLIARLQAGRDDYDVLGLDVVWTAEFAANQYVERHPGRTFRAIAWRAGRPVGRFLVQTTAGSTCARWAEERPA